MQRFNRAVDAIIAALRVVIVIQATGIFAIAIFALWPWSGIIARALPIVRNYDAASGDVRPIGWALAANEERRIDVPPHVRHALLTISGGQMARFKPGRIIGTIEATDRRGHITTREIRIGDVSDFGFLRREQFLGSRNPFPRFSPGATLLWSCQLAAASRSAFRHRRSCDRAWRSWSRH